jgi:tRNA (cytidine/uridine-2'-O-)-methyltransferase
VFALAKKGGTPYDAVHFRPGDTLVFGPESVGLPDDVLELEWITDVLHIPMVPGVRSLNLSNSVAIVTYEAWRQNAYRGREER